MPMDTAHLRAGPVSRNNRRHGLTEEQQSDDLCKHNLKGQSRTVGFSSVIEILEGGKSDRKLSQKTENVKQGGPAWFSG